jgi:hypothetical protein
VSALYDRRVDLAVGKATPKANEAFVEALRITGLRVTFKVEKDLKPEPNKSEITVYNLGPESRQALETNGGTGAAAGRVRRRRQRLAVLLGRRAPHHLREGGASTG